MSLYILIMIRRIFVGVILFVFKQRSVNTAYQTQFIAANSLDCLTTCTNTEPASRAILGTGSQSV